MVRLIRQSWSRRARLGVRVAPIAMLLALVIPGVAQAGYAPANRLAFGFLDTYDVNAGTPFSAELQAWGDETDFIYTLTLAFTFGDKVHFTSSDPQATLPADYTFSSCSVWVPWYDCGGHTFSFTLRTSGEQTITATDVTHPSIRSATLHVRIQPLAATSMTVTGLPSTWTQGAQTSAKVSLKDVYGNLAAAYRGTVAFTNTDPLATALPDYTFTAADAGQHAFDVTFNSTGWRLLTAVDKATPTLTANAHTTITDAPYLYFESGGTAYYAGSGLGGHLQAFPANGSSVWTGYRGTVHFTSSDPKAELPADYTFTATDAGSSFSVLNDVVLKTAGQQTVTARDVANSLIVGTRSVYVYGGDTKAITALGLPGSVQAGASAKVGVYLWDAWGNLAGDIKTVHVTSSDPKALLPADFTLHPTDFGYHKFYVTLTTAGVQTVTFAVKGYPLAVTLSTIVLPGSPDQLILSGISSPRAAGVAAALTVRVADTWGNTTPMFAGTIHVGTTDPAAVVEADHAYAPGIDAGVHGFAVTLQSSGSFNVWAEDQVEQYLSTTIVGIVVDGVKPIAKVVAPATPTKAATLAYNLAFSEPVTGLTASDFTRTGTATGCVVGTPTGSGTSWSVAVTGCTQGTVVLGLKAGAVRDAVGNAGPAAAATALTVTIDRTAPALTSGPATALRTGASLGTASPKTIPVRVSWTATDTGGAGIARYEYTRSANGGAWSAAASITVSPLSTTVPVGGTVQFRVRPVDKAGNFGAWVAGPVLKPSLSELTASSPWLTATSAAYCNGSTIYASTGGASATYTFTGRAIALVTTLAISRGSVQVYVDGTLTATVSTYATTTVYQRVAWAKTWASAATHTVKFVVAGTSGHARVDVDAFAILR